MSPAGPGTPVPDLDTPDLDTPDLDTPDPDRDPRPADEAGPRGGPGTGAASGVGRRSEVTRFGGLRIRFDSRLLRPRPWTMLQAMWAVDLAASLPPGRIVELCTGAGHIGLETARRTQRPVLLVDDDPHACATAAANARANDLAHLVEVRCCGVTGALRRGDDPVLVLADPPYVPLGELATYPRDPRRTIDGGDDGLRLVRAAVVEASASVSGGAPMLLQLRGEQQAAELERWLSDRPALDVAVADVRCAGPDRAVALLRAGR